MNLKPVAWIFLLLPFQIHAQTCLDPKLQEQAIASYNSVAELTKPHGKVIALNNIKKPPVEMTGELVSCSGTYTFEDGTKQDMGYTFSTGHKQPEPKKVDPALIARMKQMDKATDQCIKDNFPTAPPEALSHLGEICARSVPIQTSTNNPNLVFFASVDHCPACEKNETKYYDASKISVSKDKRFVTIPFVTDYVTPQNWIDGGTYLSNSDNNIFDCQKKQFKSLETVFFSDLDGQGTVVSTMKSNGREEWISVKLIPLLPPEFVKMISFACSFAN